MARRRMISNNVIDSDAFLCLEPNTQLLYFYLCLKADDDGFVGSPMLIARITCCGEKDLALLAEKGFILRFPSGVLTIVHWHVHNTIKKDRYVRTLYSEEMAALTLRDKLYTLSSSPKAEPEPQDAPAAPAVIPDKSDSGARGSENKPQENIPARNKKQEPAAVEEKDDAVYLRYLYAYNDICIALPAADILSEARRRAMQAAEKIIAPMKMQELFHMVQDSDFLTGRKGNWTGCNLDWILKEENLRKIIAGNYKNFSQPRRKTLVEEYDLDAIDTLDFVDDPDFEKHYDFTRKMRP